MNFGLPNSNPVALLDYTKNMVCNIMLQADDSLRKMQKPKYMMDSSESESENGSNSNRIEMFKSVIEEYIGDGEKTSSWHKSLVQATVINESYFEVYLGIHPIYNVFIFIPFQSIKRRWSRKRA